MTFNLTESPWIRAGRQYSVRVGLTNSGKHRVTKCLLMIHFYRTYGHTQTMGQPYEILQLTTSRHTVSLLCFSKMLVTNQRDCSPNAVSGGNAQTGMAPVSVVDQDLGLMPNIATPVRSMEKRRDLFILQVITNSLIFALGCCQTSGQK